MTRLPSRSTLFPYTTLFRSIPIKGAIFPGSWEFNIRGVYRGRRPQDDTTQFWFRWDYFDERKTFTKRSESTRLNSSHSSISYAVFCLKKKKKKNKKKSREI